MIFGKKWTDAHYNWQGSVQNIADKVMPILQKVGKVWFQEAGQSNTTADWIDEILKTVSEEVVKTNVFVVQHRNWNEKKTTQTELSWLKANTDYIVIEDGNKSNATPGFKDDNTICLQKAKASDNSNVYARKAWMEASRICDEWTASWDNEVITAGGVDFSDVVEFWWIFELGKKANTISSFWDRYVVNLDS